MTASPGAAASGLVLRAGALVVLGGLLVACGPDHPAPSPRTSLEIDPQRPRQLAGMAVVSVDDVTGPGGRPFAAAARTPHIGQYPCGACHEQPVTDPGAAAPVSLRWTHLDVGLEHAAALRCATCHRYDDLGTLRLIEGEPVDFDHSYRVCAQCHAPQARDWAGGAHGKRLGGWRGERVVQNCTGCHDPHAPAFPERMPLGFPRVPRTGSGGDR